MIAQPKKTRLLSLNEIPWGTHICQFYRAKEDLLNILGPYFKSGLAHNQCCIWVTSEPLKEARQQLSKAVSCLADYIKREQLLIVDYKSWYAPGGELNTKQVLLRWFEAEKFALRKGYDGLRAAGVMPGTSDIDWQSLVDYEASVDRVISKRRIIALCIYPFYPYQAVKFIHLLANHAVVIIRRNNRWVSISLESADSRSQRYRNRSNFKLTGHSQKAARILASHKKIKIETKTSVGSALDQIQGMLKTKEASELLGVHINTLRRWSNQGKIKAYILNSRGDRRYLRSDLDLFVKSAKR